MAARITKNIERWWFICNGQMEKTGAVGQIPITSGIYATMMRNGASLFTMMENFLKCLFWNLFKQGYPGNVF